MEPNKPAPASSVTPEDLRGDLVGKESTLYGVVWANPERMSGEPCFFATRIPVRTLFDYVRAGQTLDEFHEDFPDVTREQIDRVLGLAEDEVRRAGHAA